MWLKIIMFVISNLGLIKDVVEKVIELVNGFPKEEQKEVKDEVRKLLKDDPEQKLKKALLHSTRFDSSRL
jgi:hypothetical protein